MLKTLSLFAASFLLTLLSLSVPVSAARPAKTGGGSSQPTYGIDISYPQCDKRVPTDQAFGIVGVNGGNTGNFNPCLTDQLVWASRSSGTTNQPKMQMYVNTGNPGEVQDQMTLTKWPAASSPENPYPSACSGGNDQACSWQYGWDRAIATLKHFQENVPTGIDANPSLYSWWLDVETSNSWQGETLTNPYDWQFDNNIAALEGWTAYFKSINVNSIGLYSTTYQWGRITGGRVTESSNLNGLPTWYALGSTTAKNAAKACTSQSALTTGGRITITQYVSKNLDYNHSCS